MPEVCEDDVYIGARDALRARSWKLIGGQPPAGCDHLPVIEIKLQGRQGIGSLGAFKPDLVAYRLGLLLLVECKPRFDLGDLAKLREILNSRSRLLQLHAELTQRRLFKRNGIESSAEAFPESVRGALAYAGIPKPLADLAVLGIDNSSGVVVVLPPLNPDPRFASALA